jgi:thiamine biosynthesis lipoprotein
MSGYDVSFRAMGSDVRLIVGEPAPGAPPSDQAGEAARDFIARFEACASRFRPESELCALNASPRESVPASPMLRDVVRAGIWAARRTGGLVDPTLLGELEAAGYRESREGAQPASLREALAFAPPRAPAGPNPGSRWARIEVDEMFGVVRRPAGVRIDSGGVGKGLAADLVAEQLSRYSRFVIDCGGDLRVGGFAPPDEGFEILAEHPLTGELGQRLLIDGGAVATSGLDVRIWRLDDGHFAHHLLDPSTGRSAWTGLIGATALAPTALEAETLSKAALLLGPDGARQVLAPRGGLVVHEDGEVERIGRIAASPRVVISVPAGLVRGRAAA